MSEKLRRAALAVVEIDISRLKARLRCEESHRRRQTMLGVLNTCRQTKNLLQSLAPTPGYVL